MALLNGCLGKDCSFTHTHCMKCAAKIHPESFVVIDVDIPQPKSD